MKIDLSAWKEVGIKERTVQTNQRESVRDNIDTFKRFLIASTNRTTLFKIAFIKGTCMNNT